MSQRRIVALLAGLLVVTALAYLPAVDGEFLFDDDLVLKDALVRAPFTHRIGGWLGSRRPLTTFTFALNRLAVGNDTRGWHLTSIAVHLGVVVLAWLLLQRTLGRAGLTRPAIPALFGAALFALHPLQTESVAYLSQRAEALASGLYLLALLLLLARDQSPEPSRRALLAGAASVQALGALAKPIVATLPAAWLLHAAILPAPGEEGDGVLRRVRRRLAPAAPLFALSLASALVEIAASRGSAHAGFDMPDRSPLRYLLTQLRVVPTYLRLALWPAGQCADWEIRVSEGPGDPAAIAGGLLLAAIVAGAIALAARSRGCGGDGAAAGRVAAFGLLFFLLALAPSSSVVPLLDPLAEHRVYLALLGLAAAAASGGAWLARRAGATWGARLGGVAALAVLVALGAATAHRAAVWTTRIALWSDAADKAPGKARVHVNLGTAFFYAKRFDEAVAEFHEAGALGEDRTAPPDEVLRNVLAAQIAARRWDDARAELAAARERSPGWAAPLGLLAQLELMAGRPDDAERAALEALAIDPGEAFALKVLGKLRASRGELDAARALLVRAAEGRPQETSTFVDLARVEERLGHREEACAAWRRAAEDPGWPLVAATAERGLRALGCE